MVYASEDASLNGSFSALPSTHWRVETSPNPAESHGQLVIYPSATPEIQLGLASLQPVQIKGKIVKHPLKGLKLSHLQTRKSVCLCYFNLFVRFSPFNEVRRPPCEGGRGILTFYFLTSSVGKFFGSAFSFYYPCLCYINRRLWQNIESRKRHICMSNF
jgi:hypothetical protein